jgi:hypothetical protein
MHKQMNKIHTLERNERMSSNVAGQDFVNIFSSTIWTKLSLIIITMDDVDLDGNIDVANMLFLFGGVTKPTTKAGITNEEVVVRSSFNLLARGWFGDDVTSVLW